MVMLVAIKQTYAPPCSVKATFVLTSPFPLLVDAATDT